MAADALERSVLESKDREQLMTIASALGVKSTSRAKKADLIQKILEQTGAIPSSSQPSSQSSLQSTSQSSPSSQSSAPSAVPTATTADAGRLFDADHATTAAPADIDVPLVGEDGEPLADWEIELLRQGISTDTSPVAPSRPPQSGGNRSAGSANNGQQSPPSTGAADSSADGDADGDDDGEGDGGLDGDGESRNRRRRRRRNKNRPDGGPDAADRPEAPRSVSVSGNPSGGNQVTSGNGNGNGNGGNGGNGQAAGNRSDGNRSDGNRNEGNRNDGNRADGNRNEGNRSERDTRNERTDRSDRGDRGDSTDISLDPVEVGGYLDLRDEGYGFLRVNGYLASRDDAYIPVKLTRQFGLRKGDHITGLSRPAGRNEKNPALLEVHTVNGDDPETTRDRPRFEDLTPVFPDTRLTLENTDDPSDATSRIIDLISPIGKGQRGLVVSPPKAGRTTILQTIATSIERNHPEVTLIVLLIDERPEEVTEMRRAITGEVVASTFDRPGEEHIHVAELCIERAKRLVEKGDDVVLLLDGLTRLCRAYNLNAASNGRTVAGAIDAGALYPAKKLFGAARNVEAGGSLTIVATAVVDSNSRVDDAIFEEFAGTANMELRLDRHLAEQRIYPAIDVDASSTRNEELLLGADQLAQVWALRRSLSGGDQSTSSPLEQLRDRLQASSGNDALLAGTV